MSVVYWVKVEEDMCQILEEGLQLQVRILTHVLDRALCQLSRRSEHVRLSNFLHGAREGFCLCYPEHANLFFKGM